MLDIAVPLITVLDCTTKTYVGGRGTQVGYSLAGHSEHYIPKRLSKI